MPYLTKKEYNSFIREHTQESYKMRNELLYNLLEYLRINKLAKKNKDNYILKNDRTVTWEMYNMDCDNNVILNQFKPK